MIELMNLKKLKNSNLLTIIYVNNVDRLEGLSETFFSISKQIYKTDLVVLHSPNIGEKDLEVITSKLDKPSIIVRSKDEEGKIKEEVLESEEKINYTLIPFDKLTFSEIFNFGFNLAADNGYELISLVEPEDVVGLAWYNQVNVYLKDCENIDGFVPIVSNTTNGVFNGLLNEAPWAEGMAEEAGKLDMNLLTRFNCILPLGGVFKVEALKEYSEQKEDEKFYPIKESVKLAHYYEFFLRMVYNDLKIMTIPRIGYEMRLNTNQAFREYTCKIPSNLTSLPEELGGMTQAEATFWMDLAKKEYFFDEDRNKKYEPTQL